MDRDYLKYMKLVRTYIKYQYGISLADLEMLLFLKSEGRFKKTQFNEYANIIGWDRQRFERLRSEGWIDVYRKAIPKSKVYALYELSFKAKRMLTSFYKKLEGEDIPLSHYNNMTRSDASYTEKVHRHYMKQLQADLRKKKFNL